MQGGLLTLSETLTTLRAHLLCCPCHSDPDALQGVIQYFYNVLGDHAVDYKSSTHFLRHQGNDVSTGETFSRKNNHQEQCIFNTGNFPVESLAIIALREYWPLLQSCGVCSLFLSVIAPCACHKNQSFGRVLTVSEYLFRFP